MRPPVVAGHCACHVTTGHRVPSPGPSTVGPRREVEPSCLQFSRRRSSCTWEARRWVAGGSGVPRGAAGRDGKGLGAQRTSSVARLGGRREEVRTESPKARRLGGCLLGCRVGLAPRRTGCLCLPKCGERCLGWRGGRSHGNRRIPSVASDNLPCASGSVAPPLRCQATPAEFVLMPGVECG